jgi:hypothetical protein
VSHDHDRLTSPRRKKLQRVAFALRRAASLLRSGASLHRGSRRDRKIVVSFTTYHKRIATVGQTIRTLLSQSVKPDAIVLWLYRGDLGERGLPPEFRLFQRMGLTVRLLDEDLKSYKKLVHALQEWPDDLIITCDDDAYYPFDFVRGLLEAHRRFPEAVVGHRCRWMAKQGSEIASYRIWRVAEAQDPSFNVFPTGVGGVLYPPRALHPDVLRKDLFMTLCRTNDDVWFKFMALAQGTKACSVDGRFREFENVPGTQDEALWQLNYSPDRCDNDILIRNASALYDVAAMIE